MSNQVQNAADPLSVSNADFETFREFFYKHTGMLFEESKRYYVDKRLIERMEATRSTTFRDYLAMARLEASGAEVQALVNALTVNETYFFRDLAQIECLTYRMLPEVLANQKGVKKTIKIWSSPCSSGEEPYSIAIHLLEYWPQVDDYEIEIFGTDIDSRVIQQAASGIYSMRSTQNLPKHILKRYFTPVSGDRLEISADLRGSIHFQQVNIMNAAQTRSFRDFDIIFSRNMLIYFDSKSRRIAAQTFFDALKPGGFVCLAPTEPMNNITSLFKTRSFPGVTTYQRPL